MNFSAQGMLAATYDNTNSIQIQGDGHSTFEVKAFNDDLQITMFTQGKSSEHLQINGELTPIAQYEQNITSKIIFEYLQNKLSACKHKASDIRVEDFKQEITEITLSGRSKEDHGVTRG